MHISNSKVKRIGKREAPRKKNCIQYFQKGYFSSVLYFEAWKSNCCKTIRKIGCCPNEQKNNWKWQMSKKSWKLQCFLQFDKFFDKEFKNSNLSNLRFSYNQFSSRVTRYSSRSTPLIDCTITLVNLEKIQMTPGSVYLESLLVSRPRPSQNSLQNLPIGCQKRRAHSASGRGQANNVTSLVPNKIWQKLIQCPKVRFDVDTPKPF